MIISLSYTLPKEVLAIIYKKGTYHLPCRIRPKVLIAYNYFDMSIRCTKYFLPLIYCQSTSMDSANVVPLELVPSSRMLRETEIDFLYQLLLVFPFHHLFFPNLNISASWCQCFVFIPPQYFVLGLLAMLAKHQEFLPCWEDLIERFSDATLHNQ